MIIVVKTHITENVYIKLFYIINMFVTSIL